MKVKVLAIVLLFASFARGGEYLESISQENANLLIHYTKETVSAHFARRGVKMNAPIPQEVRSAKNGVHVIFLKDGQVAHQAHASGVRLIGNIARATRSAIGNANAKAIGKCSIVLTVMHEPRKVDTRVKILPWLNPEAGIEGVRLTLGRKTAFSPPLDGYLRGTGWSGVLMEMLRKLDPSATGIGEAGAEKVKRLIINPKLKVEILSSTTIVSQGDQPQILYRFEPLVKMSAVNRKSVYRAISLACRWYENNQRKDGSFPYRINTLGTASNKSQNIMKKFNNAKTLGLVWKFNNNKKIRTRGLKCLDNLIRKSYLEGQGVGYIKSDNKISLGNSAAALMAIMSLEAEKAEPAYAKKSKKLASFIKFLRQGNGLYTPYHFPSGNLNNRELYSGMAQEALMSLFYLNNVSELEKMCMDSQRKYQKLFEQHIQKRQPPYTLIRAHSNAATKLYKTERLDSIADFIINGGQLMIGDTQLMPGGPRPHRILDRQGAFLSKRVKHKGKSRAATTAQSVIALLNALEISRATGNSKVDADLRKAILWGTRHMLQLQVSSKLDLMGVPEPDKYMGAFKSRVDSSSMRIDDMAWCVAALVRIAQDFSEKDYILGK